MFTIKCSHCSENIEVVDNGKKDVSCSHCSTLNQLEEEDKYLPRLLIIHGNDKGKEFKIRENYISLGRANDNPIQLREPKASRKHASITFKDGRYYLQDLKSGNGTHLNGDPIERQVLLNDKDWMRIGDAVLMFRNVYNYSPVAAVLSDPSPLERTKVELDYDAQRTFILDDYQNMEEVERANKKLRILYEVNHAISSILDLEELLSVIMDTVFKYIPAERGAILLYEENIDSLKIVTTKIRNSKPDEKIRISNTLMDRVVKNRRSILTEDTELDENLKDAPSIVLHGVRSAMSVPLVSKDTLLGVLHIDSSEKSKQFNKEVLELLMAIGGQAAIAIENAKLLQKIEREIQTRSNLQRYLAPQLVDQVVNNQIDMKTGGQLKQATVLFTDLRGFTTMTENIGAEAVVAVLNDYFTRMVDIIFKTKGTLDKFMGDAIMGIWGIPISNPQDPELAVTAAIEMQKELFYFNLSQKKMGRNTLKMGAGINTGSMIVGNMGSPKRMEYTVIGPPVNLASRVEYLTGRNHVFITDYTYNELKEKIRCVALESTRVKGIDRDINIFSVIGIRYEEELENNFLPVLIRDPQKKTEAGEDIFYEGLVQSYDESTVVINTELVENFQQGATTDFYFDIPRTVPEDKIAIEITKAESQMHNMDEYLCVEADIKELPDSVRQFFEDLFGGKVGKG